MLTHFLPHPETNLFLLYIDPSLQVSILLENKTWRGFQNFQGKNF